MQYLALALIALSALSSSGEQLSDTHASEVLARKQMLPLEWHYEVLFGDWSSGKERVFHSVVPEDELGALFRILNARAEGGVVTYEVDISEEESVYNPVVDTESPD